MGGRQLELGGGAVLVARSPADPCTPSSPGGELELPARPVRTIHDSPLWTGEHSLYGRIVTHPLELEALEVRVGRRPRPRLVLTPYVAALLAVIEQPWLAYIVLLVLLIYVARKVHP